MAKLNGYWEWAQSDPLIAGLNCWHWTTITGLYKRAPGIIPFYYGVDHMPKVVTRLNEIGAIIQNQQSTPSSRNHPIKSDDSDATDAHDDGTGGDSVTTATFGTPHLLGQANSEPSECPAFCAERCVALDPRCRAVSLSPVWHNVMLAQWFNSTKQDRWTPWERGSRLKLDDKDAFGPRRPADAPLTLTTGNGALSLRFDPAGAITGTRLGPPKAAFQSTTSRGGVALRAFPDENTFLFDKGVARYIHGDPNDKVQVSCKVGFWKT